MCTGKWLSLDPVTMVIMIMVDNDINITMQNSRAVEL